VLSILYDKSKSRRSGVQPRLTPADKDPCASVFFFAWRAYQLGKLQLTYPQAMATGGVAAPGALASWIETTFVRYEDIGPAQSG